MDGIRFVTKDLKPNLKNRRVNWQVKLYRFRQRDVSRSEDCLAQPLIGLYHRRKCLHAEPLRCILPRTGNRPARNAFDLRSLPAFFVELVKRRAHFVNSSNNPSAPRYAHVNARTSPPPTDDIGETRLH
jgi:hypothetical protein